MRIWRWIGAGILGSVTLATSCADETDGGGVGPTTTGASDGGAGDGGSGGEAGEGGAPGGAGGVGGDGGAGGGGATGCLRTEAGITAGVPAEPVCPDPTCSSDVPCNQVTVVAAGDDLQAAARAAGSGDCLALEPGSYGDVDLPAGVSLLGRAAADVTVGAVSALGDGVLVRGFTAAGITMSGPGDIIVDRVVVRQSESAGVIVLDADVTIVDSCIADSADAGLYVACSNDCGCPAALGVDIQRMLALSNSNVGVWLDGAVVSATDAIIVETQPLNFAAGYGVYAADCTLFDASRLVVADSAQTGVFLDAAGGALGPDLTIRDNRGGMAACAVPPSTGLDLAGFAVTNNGQFGIVVGGGSAGVALGDGVISGTTLRSVPTPMMGIEMIGDGIDWLDDSAVVVASTVQIEQSGRAAAVIDASSNGSFDAVLAGVDETVGIFLQNGAAPAVGGGVMQTIADPPLYVPAYCP